MSILFSNMSETVLGCVHFIVYFGRSMKPVIYVEINIFLCFDSAFARSIE